jgi:hypothetical protein
MKYNESKDKVQGHGMMMLCGDMMVMKKSPLVGNKFMACGISDQNKIVKVSRSYRVRFPLGC